MSDHITHLSESLWLLRLVGQRPASWLGQKVVCPLQPCPARPPGHQQVCTPALPKQSTSSCFEVYLQVSKSHNRNDPKCTPPSCPNPPTRRQTYIVYPCLHKRQPVIHRFYTCSPNRCHTCTAPSEAPGTSPAWPLPRLQVTSSIFVLKVLQRGAWWECWGLAGGSGTLQSRPPGRRGCP